MNSTSKVWLPAGLDEGYQQPLSVPLPSSPMSRSLYVSLLEAKIQRLIDLEPQQAKQAMQMSQESAPGLWSIQEHYPRNQWASAIVRSDQATTLLSQVQWDQMLSAEPEPDNLLELLEMLA